MTHRHTRGSVSSDKRLHLATMVLLMVGHSLVHYGVLLPLIGKSIEHLPFFDLHVLHEAEFLVVIAYANWVFRLQGGIVALAATALASTPFILASRINPLEHAEYGFGGPGNALIEVAVLMSIGGFIVLINERWARERDRKVRVVAQLEQANIDLARALDELKATQARLVQHERLSALGSMASGIVHDFQNMLTPIRGFSELLLQAQPGRSSPAKDADYLKQIHVAATDAMELVDRLREFYRPSGEGATPQPIDLNEVMAETLALAETRRRSTQQTTGMLIAVEHEAQPVPLIQGNASELRQALLNLLVNAFDALPHGGTVWVRTRSDLGQVVLEVADNGTGMSDEVLHRCVEPFFTTKGEHGTGLGLAMVHGAIQRHGGSLTIRSVVGKGTTFELRFPQPAAGQAGPDPVQVPVHAIANKQDRPAEISAG